MCSKRCSRICYVGSLFSHTVRCSPHFSPREIKPNSAGAVTYFYVKTVHKEFHCRAKLLFLFSLYWTGGSPLTPPPSHPLVEASSPYHHSLARSADQIILSAPCTTVATETLCECLCVRYCWGIGCWGLDAFQSNLLPGCGSTPPWKNRAREKKREWSREGAGW